MHIAVAQLDIHLGRPERNLAAMLDMLRVARGRGAELTIFPECALTGYCFASLDDALPFAQSIPGPATEAFVAALGEIGGAVLFGMLEATSQESGPKRPGHSEVSGTLAESPSGTTSRDSAAPRERRPPGQERRPPGVFNVAVLVDAAGVRGCYRKIHLPHLGVDQYSTYGDRPFEVWPVGDVNLGPVICYDSAFPESIRMLSLLGADLIALPTNFPTGAESMTDHVLRTRAVENNVYFACSNRIGEEAGFRFIGGSQVIDPTGKVLAKAGTEETILYAEIDPARARNKRVVRSPGKHAIDRLADRRPEMYAKLIESHELRRPRDEV